MIKEKQRLELSKPSALPATSGSALMAPAAKAVDSHANTDPKGDSVWQNLARELHDGVTQEVWYLQTELSYMSDRLDKDQIELRADLERLKKIAQEAYQELRTTLDMLHSRSVSYSTLGNDLSELTQKFSESVDMKVVFECEPKAWNTKVRGDVARQVRRLVQEALWNSLQHSRSETAKVTLKESKAGLMVNVSDNGCGFDPDTVETNHYGLRNMRERAEAINGSLYVTSQKGKGTLISLQVPTAENEG